MIETSKIRARWACVCKGGRDYDCPRHGDYEEMYTDLDAVLKAVDAAQSVCQATVALTPERVRKQKKADATTGRYDMAQNVLDAMGGALNESR